jgi:hypothetical protein
MKEINRLDELGMVDPPLLPICDGAGLYRRIQRDPVTSQIGKSGGSTIPSSSKRFISFINFYEEK